MAKAQKREFTLFSPNLKDNYLPLGVIGNQWQTADPSAAYTPSEHAKKVAAQGDTAVHAEPPDRRRDEMK